MASNESDGNGKLKVFLQKNGKTLLIVALAIVVAYLFFSNGSNNVQYGEDDLYSSNNAQTMISPQPRAVATPVGSQELCFRLDGSEGRHLPALMGSGVADSYPNGLPSGYNFALMPSDDETKPYGLLNSGVVYAKEAWLKKWGMNSFVEIKAAQKAFEPIQMELAEIGGEAAYVYKLNL